jgi:PST family polysaccharide transporter
MTRWWPSLRFSRAAAMEMVSFGVGVYAKNLFDYASQNFDNLVVGRVLGVEALGYYDKAFSLMARVVGRINLAGPSVSFRVFAVIHEEAERFRRAYRKVILSITFFGYPLLTGMMVAGPQLIEVLFGRRWMSVTAPFQILCVAAMLRLLNTYASTATQAKGQIWSEVKRQAFFVTVLVVAVFAFSRWGIAGSAFGVLVATVIMTVLLQTLVRRLASLTWGDLFVPQVPAVVCSAGVAVVIVIVRGAVRSALHSPSALVILTACFVATSIYYLAFGLLAPFTELRAVVHETAQDLAPRFLARRLEWLAPASVVPPAAMASGQ